ncbi:hypothetical protein HanIR_Chr15g0729061 [Helianthus annuus]|nr:hypothetical protein HanIR_Chr15g0729061 [Helianthus annuus]
MDPWSLLDLRTRTRKLVLLPKKHGYVSFMLFFLRFNTSSILQLTKDFGIFPSIPFPCRSRVFKPQLLGYVPSI